MALNTVRLYTGVIIWMLYYSQKSKREQKSLWWLGYRIRICLFMLIGMRVKFEKSYYRYFPYYNNCNFDFSCGWFDFPAYELGKSSNTDWFRLAIVPLTNACITITQSEWDHCILAVSSIAFIESFIYVAYHDN